MNIPGLDQLNPDWRSKFWVSYLRTGDHPAKLRIMGWLRKLLRLRIICARDDYGVWFALYPEDSLQYEVLYFGAYERLTVDLVRKLLSTDSVFIDVGGHIGDMSLPASAVVGPRGKVVVVEPNPISYLFLKKNIELNNFNNVFPVLCAVGESEDILNMVIPTLTNWGQARSAQMTNPSFNFHCAKCNLASIKNSFDIDKIDLLKIDVEGMELEIIDDLFNGKSIFPTHLIIEYIPELIKAQGEEPARLIRLLKEHGYSVYDVVGNEFKDGMTLTENNLWAARRRDD